MVWAGQWAPENTVMKLSLSVIKALYRSLSPLESKFPHATGAVGMLVTATLETTLGQMAPPKSGPPLRMLPESGGIPGRVHFWKVSFALVLYPGS